MYVLVSLIPVSTSMISIDYSYLTYIHVHVHVPTMLHYVQHLISILYHRISWVPTMCVRKQFSPIIPSS